MTDPSVIATLPLAHPGQSDQPITLRSGEIWAVIGPSASGKSRVLASVVESAQDACYVEDVDSPRATPQKLLSKAVSKPTPDQIGTIFSVLNLWEARKVAYSQLSSGQQAACRWIEPMAIEPALVVDDLGLDSLDPWVRGKLIDWLVARRQTCLVATHDLELAQAIPNLIVLHEGQALWAGPTASLLESAGMTEFEIRTEDPSTVLQLVEPFAINAVVQNGRVLFQAPEGQRRAAELLTQGYGVVNVVGVRPPSLREAIDSLIARARP